MRQKPPVLILSAGRIPIELECIFGNIPNGLIPLNRKPILFWIIDNLVNEGFDDIYITVGFNKDKLVTLLDDHYKSKISFKYIEVDYEKKPGNAILRATKKIVADNLLVILGDTLVNERLSSFISNKSFVLSSKNFLEAKRWCIIDDHNGKVDNIYDKQKLVGQTGLYAIIGIYFFSNLRLLKDIAADLDSDADVEISSILRRYKMNEPIVNIEYNDWYDVGHIDNYYSAKKRLLQSRFFNHLEFDDLLGVIKKTSDNKEKLQQEIKWYLNVPKELSVLTPRILDYNLGKNAFVKMEYIGYPTLSELWLYGELHPDIWKNIIDRLLRIIEVFRKYLHHVSEKDHEIVYVNKTDQRIEQLISKNRSFDKLLHSEYIVINNLEYRNWFSIRNEVYNRIKRLYNVNDNCFIHGDLCFPNILYDIQNGIFKFVDPRGKWGSGHYGDIKYDIAKLRHSISGNYDSIINGLYTIDVNENNISLKIFKEEKHREVAEYYDAAIQNLWNLDDIALIEGLLFISMLPLHIDDIKKLYAFYSIGIAILNDIIWSA